MESVTGRLQKIGLTEYEAKAYVSLLSDHMSNASALARKSGVPRTKIYSVLESLQEKGWIKIYSGIPLLFRAVEPREAIAGAKKEYDDLFDAIGQALSSEAVAMKEKFVVLRHDIGLGGLKDEVRSAKTVQITNAPADLVERLADIIRPDALVQVVLFPGEKKLAGKGFQFREAGLRIVSIVRSREVPSATVLLDESRIFTVMVDPVDERYIVSEMLSDECCGCMSGLFNMGWDSAREV